ncbi:hypothetical protein PSU4_33760 [Pseudonocardia sulfidoxydans NBRC 16205]|uniref:DUF4192 domain-containing protein n=1 Tax=Pseudonocardia sulfidoxydans NBRC 16205 TaxID=1223511 RepID=A0A511DHZ3_9PSEU|nr:DUF4192 domain-containing protein [Pseudonocardia sulfidoxydans]GEL24422.1 hypothetical protein PSU4_33760 [Pseudonocardia sulfidoxydans NBRC 16205]
MTSAGPSRSARHPAGRRTPTSVRGPGELVAAVPVLLGFHPERSLVVVSTHGPGLRTVGVTLRADLPGPDNPDDVDELCDMVARCLVDAAGPGPLGAAVVVVDGPVDGGPAPGVPDLVDAAAAALLAAGVSVVGTRVWTAATTAGAAWACTDPCGCSGTVADAHALPLTAAAVVAGAVVRASRTEIVASLQAPDVERLRRRAALFDRELDLHAASLDMTSAQAALESALGATAAATLVLDDARVLDLAVALQTPEVRDAALRECIGPRAATAEQLWAALVRETPEPESAEAAALLAVAALARGDGALANIAVDRARQAWPGHRLAEALAEALANGFGPAQVRAWLADGQW